jgi:hypothetical protein
MLSHGQQKHAKITKIQSIFFVAFVNFCEINPRKIISLCLARGVSCYEGKVSTVSRPHPGPLPQERVIRIAAVALPMRLPRRGF